MTDSLQFPDHRVEEAHVRGGTQYRQQLQRATEFIQSSGMTAEDLLALQRQVPNAAPGTMESGLVMGLQPEQYAAVAQRDPGHDDFKWYDPTDWFSEGLEKATGALKNTGSFLYQQVLKPVVRGAFAITEGLAQEGIQRPLSALAAGAGASDEDVSVREAYNQYGTSALFQALGNVVGEDQPDEVGKGFDLGTGFFTGGAAQLQAEEARRLTVAGQKANMGRLYLDNTLQSVGLEPGDRIYDIGTGVAQFAFDVFTDPSILLTAGTGTVAKGVGRLAGTGSKLLGGTDDVVRVGGKIRAASEVGEEAIKKQSLRVIPRHQAVRERAAEVLTIDGIGPRFRASRRFEQVQDEAGDLSMRLRQKLFDEDFEEVVTEGGKELRLIEDAPQRTVDDLADRMSKALDEGDEELRGLLQEQVGLIEGPNGKSALFDKLSAFTRKDGLLESIAEADYVALANSFKAGRDTSIPRKFLLQLDQASTKEEVAAILNEAISVGHLKQRNFYGGFGSFARKHLPGGLLEKADKFTGMAARGYLDANDLDMSLGKLDTFARQAGLSREQRNEIFRRMSAMDEGDFSELFEIATDVYDMAGARLRGIDPEAGSRLKELTRAYQDDLQSLRKFNADEIGENAPGLVPRYTKKMRNGEVEEVVAPTPHLLNEFNQLAVPIPDIDDVRRAAVESDTMRAVYESAGWGSINRGLRFVTRSLFKPLVLLRPAYIARTQIDDQLRMWAAGVDGVVTNPRHLIQMAARAPDELRNLVKGDPSLQRYTRRLLNHSLLDVDGGGLVKSMRERIYMSIQKPALAPDADVATEANDFIRAWRGELGQLADDEIAHYMINNGLDIEDTMQAVLGRKIENKEVVEAIERRLGHLNKVEEKLGTGRLEDLSDAAPRARELLAEDMVPAKIQSTITRVRDGRSLDELVDPATGQSLGPQVRDIDLDDAPIPSTTADDIDEDFAERFLDDVPEAPDEEAVTLGEYLDDLREQMEADPDAFNLLPDDGEFAKNRTEYLVRALLDDTDIPAEDAVKIAKDLRDELNTWVNAADGGIQNMHTLREKSTLLDLVRQTGTAKRTTYRGERLRIAEFNQMLEEGVLDEGNLYRINRMQSAADNPARAENFAMNPNVEGAPIEGNGVQVTWRYADDVRSQNMAPLNPGEQEWIMPEQQVRIREVRKIDAPGDEDVYVIDVDGVPSEGVTGQVMNEGPQSWMHDLNRGGVYDGTPQSLAGKWDDLAPEERAEYERINEQIQTFLRGAVDDKDFRDLQYYSELRHLVDNAPTVSDELYLPASAVSLQKDKTFEHVTDTIDPEELHKGRVGQQIRTDRVRVEGTNVPQRMQRARIDPSDLDEDVVVRLPRGSQALRAGDDYIVPPSLLRVNKVRKTPSGKTIVDVEIKHQPQQGAAVMGTADPAASLQDSIRRIANSSNADVKRLLDDPVALRQYLESVRDRIMLKTGGDQEILDVLSLDGGRFLDRDMVDIQDDAAFESFLADRYDSSPDFLKAQQFDPDGEDRAGLLDQITAFGFDHIVSKPAGYLSRYPAWMEFLTRDLGDLMRSVANDDVRRKIIEVAEKASEEGGLGATAKQVDRLRKAAQEAAGSTGPIANFEEARRLALGHATQSVEDLLFDVSNRSAFQDSFDVIFPFVDAWREGLEVWGRLVAENPGAMMKGLAAFRGAEETGVLYTNEDGERMFAAPFSGAVGNIQHRIDEGQNAAMATAMGLVDTARGEVSDESIDSVQTSFDFRLSGVNMLFNSIGPGFGPVVQWPAGAFLPDTPTFSGLQEIINPYGDPFEGPGDIANPKAYIESLTPAWANKVINAWTSGNIDPLQWNSMVHDSLRALEMSGRYDLSDPQEQSRLTEDAERNARTMLLIRGLVHGVAPTGPSAGWKVKTDGVDEDFEPVRGWDPDADPDGVWHEIDSLANSYWDLYEQTGDSTLAQQKFMEAYGVTPAYLRTPKSRILSSLPATKQGAYWADEHRGAMEKYPVVAGYFAPPDEGNENFDYAVWREQFASGQREMITPAQQVALSNRSQAQQIYYNTKERLDALDIESGAKTAVLSTVKGKLEEQYPGWQIPVAGVTNIPTDAKIEQLRLAARDPELLDSPLTSTLRQYFQVRDVLEANVRAQTGVPNATLGRQEAQGARQSLKQIGTMLASRDPYFRGVWDLLKREVEE